MSYQCKRVCIASLAMFLASSTGSFAQWTKEIQFDPITDSLNYAMARNFGVEGFDDGFITYLCREDGTAEFSIMWKQSLKVREDGSKKLHEVTVRFGDAPPETDVWLGADQMSFAPISWGLQYLFWAAKASDSERLAIRTISSSGVEMTLLVDTAGLLDSVRAVDAVCK